MYNTVVRFDPPAGGALNAKVLIMMDPLDACR